MMFWQTVKQEIADIASSKYKITLLGFLPLSGFLLIIFIFKQGVLQDLPIAVVDSDHSKSSYALIHKLDSTKTLDVAYKPQSPKEAIELLKASRVYGVVVIPHNFERDLLTLSQPQLSVMLNTQYILVGKIIKSSLVEIFQDPSAPIYLQITPFFNTYQNYFVFLVSAILPAMWQILIVIVTIVSFGELVKYNKHQEFFRSHIMTKIVAKLTPYIIYFMILGSGYLLYIYGAFGWEFQGSLAFTLFAMLLTVVAYQAVALLFVVVGFDYARALSLGAAYSAPAFAFLGVTFPAQSMGAFALFWKSMLPVSHYMAIQISQANYGITTLQDFTHILAIVSFWVLFAPVYFRFK